MGAMSRNKGKVGEREVAELLRQHGFKARRGVQFHGGPDSPDVVGLPGVHIEVKRCESLSIYNAIDQSKREHKAGTIATVFHRRNKCPWLVVLSADDFLQLVKAARTT